MYKFNDMKNSSGNTIKIIEYRNEGKSYGEISKLLNISKTAISYQCNKLGLETPVNGYKNISSDVLIEMIDYYDSHTIKETVEKYHISKSSIIKYAKNKNLMLSKIEKNKKNYNRVKNRRQKLKEMGVEYLGGKCVICGYNKSIWALDYHHRNPNEKDFNISSYGNLAWEKIKKELDKCDLLCANCHREVHHNIYIAE